MEANPTPAQAEAAAGSAGNWRSDLTPEGRDRVANKILETLKRHLPVNVPEGLSELRKIAVRFEGKIYNLATSQVSKKEKLPITTVSKHKLNNILLSDYLRKISLKMLSMEAKVQQPSLITSGTPNDSAVNQNLANSGIRYETVTLSYPKPPTQWLHTPANRSVDCDRNSILEDEPSAKRRKLNEPEKISTEELSCSSEKPKEPTFSCPICLCEIVSPFTTLCGHIFCEVCIKTAIKKQKKLCPTCRTKLTGKNSIHRVFLPSLD
ncbi:E3 ubiquitin-protein ligase BRE1-like isoform X1 [Asparagus officinalis]|uniref:E3 ubiquitin-protein ligase BRE1-like isoform X1 n=1 Tax=Asparagus officinalis TaxID=4686 RepID=UPI00098DEDE8|nr:E3 ubiquitin-protein ligase BRE1-like isoform X1 [Asparagus officinalis]